MQHYLPNQLKNKQKLTALQIQISSKNAMSMQYLNNVILNEKENLAV